MFIFPQALSYISSLASDSHKQRISLGGDRMHRSLNAHIPLEKMDITLPLSYLLHP
ncbi:hypothetical protein HMPREF9134_01896 [Porphyromonas catoniae F0037]|uniref:Uncharacterized protein n=1 Tax=Porphyromonas catoniae F0037 TaxID=1127696 RepID=L1N9C8_9PORP|nr:hypothetical protein HMPREF9134_01896 [Porphyromonas catoniae F0037]